LKPNINIALGVAVIVCVCHRVSDRVIRSLASDGCDLKAVRARCGAGTDCGACAAQVRDLVRAELARAERAPCARTEAA
jgi:bacterioferritin-associated ferredoxin